MSERSAAKRRDGRGPAAKAALDHIATLASPEPRSPKRRQQPAPPRIGKELHNIRKARGLTLEQLQAASGISKSMLSQIERNLASPTFATLWHLTQALGVELGELTGSMKSDGVRSREIEHLRVYSTPTASSKDGKICYSILNPMRFALPMEWYSITVQPGGARRTNAHGNGSWEHITCVDGEITVEVDDKEVTLSEGETLRYMAEVPHGLRNDGKRVAKAFLVVIPLRQLEAIGQYWNHIDLEG